jgi:hypothetical protein
MAKKPQFNPARVHVAMEGDSWCRLPNFPFKLATVGGSDFDICRGLQALGYPVHNAAHWGETIESMAHARDYLNALSGWRPHVLFLSGGGNDLLGQKSGRQGRLVDYLKQRPSGPHNKTAAWFLLPAFDQEVTRIMSFFRVIFDDVFAHSEFRNVRILVHGYDYPVPKELVWISEPFAFRNIDEPLRSQIIKLAMDRYNAELKKLAAEYKNVHYIDLRNTVQTDWHDELHPTQTGFARMCTKIDAAIRKAV